MKRALLLAAFGGKNVSVDVMLILGVASRFKQGARAPRLGIAAMHTDTCTKEMKRDAGERSITRL